MKEEDGVRETTAHMASKEIALQLASVDYGESVGTVKKQGEE